MYEEGLLLKSFLGWKLLTEDSLKVNQGASRPEQRQNASLPIAQKTAAKTPAGSDYNLESFGDNSEEERDELGSENSDEGSEMEKGEIGDVKLESESLVSISIDDSRAE